MLLKINKKAFSLIEILLVLIIIAIIYSYSKFNYSENKLYEAANRIVIYLKETRLQALVDDKEDLSDKMWHKKRWTLKFLRCDKSIGGIYYIIYSDENKKGHANKSESMNDPLTNKKIYATNSCSSSSDTSKYVLLTKEFGIDKVELSCNDTSSLGQISFGSDGKIYSKLNNFENTSNEYEIKSTCFLKLFDKRKKSIIINIEAKSGFSHII